MDKNVILQAAQRNRDRGKEFEIHEDTASSLISFAASLMVGIILFAVDYFIKGIINVSLIIVGITALGADTLYRGIVFRKVWKIIVGSILLAIALLIIITYVVMK